MSIIPSDILASAADAAKDWEMEAGAHRMLVATIAAAIAEERKRCAKIAEKYTYASGIAKRILSGIETGA